MTIQDIKPVIDLLGTGGTGPFAFPFKVHEAADIRAFVNGVERFYPADFSVTGVGNNGGGSVTFTANTPNNAPLRLVRDTARKRDTIFPDATSLDTAVLNQDNDVVVAQVQEIFDRALLQSVGQTSSWDALGLPITNGADGVNATDFVTFQQLNSTVIPPSSISDVRSYGAVGDGVFINDTAFASAQSGAEGFLTVPEGTWLISTAWLVNKAIRISLSPNAIIKLDNASNTSMIRLNVDGSVVEGGQLDGNRANQTGTLLKGIDIGANDCAVRGVRIREMAGYGVYAGNVDRPQIRNNIITGTDYICIFHETTPGQTSRVGGGIVGNVVDQSGEPNTLVEGGIKVHGTLTTDGLRITGSVISGNHVTLPASPISSAVVCIEVFNGASDSKIFGNTTNFGSMGISADRSDGSVISVNTVVSPDLNGIEAAQCKEVTISTNTIDGGGLCNVGVSVSNPPVGDLSITGNTVLACVNNSMALRDCDGLVVSANKIRQDGINTALLAIARCNNFSLSTNTVLGDSSANTAGIFIDTSSDGSVLGNVITGMINSAVQFFANTAYTFQNITMMGNPSINNPRFIQNVISGGAAIGSGISIRNNPGEPNNYRDYGADVFDSTMAGTPEGSIAAGVGSIFHRTDGGTTVLYTKISGTGVMGWQRNAHYLNTQVTYDFGSIGANGNASTVVNIPGINSFYLPVILGLDGGLPSGFSVSAWVSSVINEEITMRIENLTGGSRNSGNRVYRIAVMNGD